MKAAWTLRRFFEANREFLTLQDEINISIVNTFLGVAMWGADAKPQDPLTIKALSERIGLPYTTVSRHLRYLGEKTRIGSPGMGLVDTKLHPIDRRQKIVHLTPKGTAFLQKLLYTMGVDDGDTGA